MNESGITYGDILENERQMSFFNFEFASRDYLYKSFEFFEKMLKILLTNNFKCYL